MEGVRDSQNKVAPEVAQSVVFCACKRDFDALWFSCKLEGGNFNFPLYAEKWETS